MTEPGATAAGAGLEPPPPAAREVTIVAHDIGRVGGMERVLAELIGGLRDRGHRVIVIARTCELADWSGVEFHRVRGPGRPFLLSYPWFLIVGSLAVRRHRRGIVQATGGIVLNRVEVIAVHYLHQVGPVNPSRSTVLFRLHAELVRHLKRISERMCFALNPRATYVCVSEGVADEVREHYPRLAARVRTIYNGVDTDAFAPDRRSAEAAALRARLLAGQSGPEGEPLLAVLVGSEWERKGLPAVVHALALAPRWHLAVAGDGDRERYQALADGLNVGERLHWLGVVRDVQLVYAAADTFTLPSSYETFSLVTFEAAASGLAILAAPVNGVRELIRDGENGFLIGRDPEQIGELLRRLAADPDLRARLGRAARESALRFSWHAMVSAHSELYAELAAARPA